MKETLSIIISILTCILLIIAILFKPSIKIGHKEISTYWIVALFGALLILILNIIPFKEIINLLFSNSVLNPLKIIILLMSLSFISISLDIVGFFDRLAYLVVKKVKASQKKLFFALFLLVAFLTMFTSNDIIILTFTIFICYFARAAKINPIPYLVMEFIVANTFSMIFIIGNPTNIYLASGFNLSFIEYFKVMVIPTILAGLTAGVILYLLFRKKLSTPFENTVTISPVIQNKGLMIITLIHLIITTILLAISNYIDIQMWLICLSSLVSLTIFLLINSFRHHDFHIIKEAYRRIPFDLGLFVLFMSIIITALNYQNVFIFIGESLNHLIHNSQVLGIFIYGSLSALMDNLINNIPMSISFLPIINNCDSSIRLGCLYATIIGSNIGAFLTPIGALAGIMWMNILKNQHVEYRFIDFTKYGLILTTTILMVALISLAFII